VTESNGLPLGIAVSGANTHDSKLLAETLDNIVIFRPLPPWLQKQNLCLDAGFVGMQGEVEKRGLIPHIRPRGEEKLESVFEPAKTT